MMIDDLLKTSWFESENENERISAGKNANLLVKKIEKASVIDCPHGCTVELVKDYTKHYKEACERNKNIAMIENKNIMPLVLIECMAPVLYGEALVVVTGFAKANALENDALLCLFLCDGYKKEPRFGKGEELPSGYLPHSKVYYEYVKIKAHQIGRIY
jgi:hypothetical protein